MIGFELTEEQRQLVDTARDFTRKEILPVASRLDEEGTFPQEICQRAWQTGLMNCEIPEAYGGLGLSCLSQGLLVEEISYGCVAVNLSIGGNGLGIMPLRSEERRVGKEGRSRWSPYH